MLNRIIAPKITNAVDFHLALPPHKKFILKNSVEPGVQRRQLV